ncbi:MAG: HTH domain-containing protein, partial [Oscillospiraceae bacterium]
MEAKERRAHIQKTLAGGSGPVSATKLAQELGVSRQIIVGDVALLRAQGADISATPRG